MSFFDDDFTTFNFPANLLDLFLKESYGLQYFKTTYGMSYSIKEGRRVLLTEMKGKELLKVFEKLQVYNPKYK
jgi:hypothetical protein